MYNVHVHIEINNIYVHVPDIITCVCLLTITVLPLTTVYFVSEVHCTLNVLHSIIHVPYYYIITFK